MAQAKELDNNLENRLQYWEVAKQCYRNDSSAFIQWCECKGLDIEIILFCIK